MKNNKFKIGIVSLVVVLVIVALVVGGTYAFFTAGNSNNNTITGSAYEIDIDLELTPIKASSSLVPLSDSDIDKAITGTYNCVDSYDNDVCSIYQVDIVNHGNLVNLYAYVKASNSTFTTDHLKYKVYTETGDNYTAVSDVITLSNNANDKKYFVYDDVNYRFGLNTDQSTTYYFVFWLSGVEEDQNEDMDETFNGVIGIEASDGENITANFGIGS